MDASLVKLFHPFASISVENIPKFNRIKIKKVMFHSDTYDQLKKAKNSVISYSITSSNESYFTCVNCNYFAIVKQLTDVKPIGSVDHVFACRNDGPLVVVPIEYINCKVVFMSFSGDTECVYIAKFPNDIEYD